MKDDTVRRLEALVLEIDEVEELPEYSCEEQEPVGGRTAA
ncbi:hypothetical protein SAMN05443637_103314 [Pseudonocardia thermophila]|jgi:hypothetical protein|uniref:Uncharacterized protein n=1 Tax=Pseudonocardia thermophila TaxID=1848 RepID=A0A1M6QGW7_PSETH|nr:hypothetical protein SAMN05443637_103314 [Pseudonocardia thermophila]